MIVIMGMAHSGTTIVAHILRQCPDLVLYCSGQQAGLLECQEVAAHIPTSGWDWRTLQSKNNALYAVDKHLLIKRPWSESRPTWWVDYFPDSLFIICFRPFSQIKESWTGPRSMCPSLKNKTEPQLWNYYKKSLKQALSFPLKNYLLEHTRLLNDPDQVLKEVAEFLKIDYVFNISQVGNGNIKNIIRK